MKRIICTILLLGSVLHASCSPSYNYPEDQDSNTLRLRDDLMKLTRSEIKEITGTTQPDEGYVLMYGYMLDNSMESLPISDSLRSKLEDIRPPNSIEIYVLAHFQGDDILDYTRWQNDGKVFAPHPNPICPFVIRGSAYRIKLKNQYGDVEVIN
jgi:hypothetical protein